MQTRILTAITLMLGMAGIAAAHERAVEFPKTEEGKVILAADLHTHTVFSDGEVWPSIRVKEARKDGLQMLAVTEHLEHQPHKEDIPHPDRNRSYEVATEALEAGDGRELFVINGAEVTRGQPHGHINAVFLDDANALLTDSPRAAIEAANEQGAFVFLNHPNWVPQQPDGIARLSDYHRELIADGLLHGIEVANGTLDGHSEHALEIALGEGLTVLGTSDIHGLVDWTHDAGNGGHRPMTLVIAETRSPEAMKTALLNGDTVAWNYDDLLGKAENVEKVVKACLSLSVSSYPDESAVLPVDIVNNCPLNFTLQNTSRVTFQNTSDVVRIERDDHFTVHARTGERVAEVSLDFSVLNTQTGFRENLDISLSADVPR
ncbi:Sb-PDE family phosphodiesterase [Henriciella sp.]|uniref:Sb-PDE family phosphodiesterase n=1 Tax=Henriciella sp. TaxID=1968823 RepID=UPI002604A268|nr:Sb-PDE family phosphodiesterase [Henriciella sp.]